MKHFSRKAYRQLVSSNWKELLRNWKLLILLFAPPLGAVFAFTLGALALSSEQASVVAVMPPGAPPAVQQVVADLMRSKTLEITVLSPDELSIGSQASQYDVLLVMPATTDGTIRLLAPSTGPAEIFSVQRALRDALKQTGGAPLSIDTVAPRELDLLPFGGISLMTFGLAALALLGLAAPLAAMREQGVLRLLGTTPVSRLTIFAALIPPRLLPGAVLIGVMMGWIGIVQKVPVLTVLLAMFVALLGFWVLCALAWLVGSRIDSSETAMFLGSALVQALLFAGGNAIPHGTMRWQKYAALVNPLDYMGDALRQLLRVQVTHHAPLWVDLTVLLGSGLFLTLLAARLFEWDQSEQRYTGPGRQGHSRDREVRQA